MTPRLMAYHLRRIECHLACYTVPPRGGLFQRPQDLLPQFAFGAQPILIGRAILASTGLPVKVSQGGDRLARRLRDGRNSQPDVRFSTRGRCSRFFCLCWRLRGPRRGCLAARLRGCCARSSLECPFRVPIHGGGGRCRRRRSGALGPGGGSLAARPRSGCLRGDYPLVLGFGLSSHKRFCGVWFILAV